MELSEALRSLMALFVEILNERSAENTETIKIKVPFGIASQSRYIRTLLGDLCWKSWGVICINGAGSVNRRQ